MKQILKYNFSNCETLIISGSGLKGFGFLGILHNLILNYNLKISNIKNFAGSSIGGLIVTLLSFGLSPIDILLTSSKALPFQLMDKNKVYDLLHNIVKDTTFKQLFDTKQINLVITSYNMNTKSPIYYHHLTHPDVTIFSAIKETINIPLFISNESHVDGNLCTPFPIKKCKDLQFNNILGLFAYTRFEFTWNTRNLYDDLKCVFCQLINNVIKYETLFIDENDQLIEYDKNLPFELYDVDIKLSIELFIDGLNFLK
jgi:hypothetical protein